MENNCNIISDLLPLCAEGIASEDSRQLVEKHVETCESCAAAYDEMKKAAVSSESDSTAELEAAPLRTVKKNIKRRRVKAASVCALLVFTVMVGIFSYLTEWQYIPYSPDLITVEDQDGGVTLSVASAAGIETTYCWTADEPQEGEQPDRLEISAWNIRWNRLTARNDGVVKTCEIPLDGINAVDYVDYANEGELIRVYGEEDDGGCIVLERLVLSYYLILSFFGAMLFGVLWLIFRKRSAGRVLSHIFFAPVSYIIGHIIATGFDSAVYNAGEKFVFNILAAAAVWTMIFIIRKKDK